MRRSFSSYRQYSIPTASVDETQIRGYGGIYTPILMVPVRLDCAFNSFQPNEAIRLHSLRGTIALSSGESLVSRDTPVDLTISPEYTPGDHFIQLDFPLNNGRITLLENFRNGQDLKFHLRLRLDAEQLYAIAEIPKSAWKSYAWAHVQMHRLHAESDVIVPRSSWIENVLPGLGFGKVHLVELPAVPLQETETIGKAFKALQQAQAFHRSGHYDEAVAKCRMAMESFWETVDGPEKDGEGRPKRIPKLKASWETKLGKATYEWLNASLTAMKQAANPTAHNPDPHYDQFQSQMIQAIVTSLISYAARHNQG